MPSYSIQADFENIDSPELIAASLAILQNENWLIKNYNSEPKFLLQFTKT